MVIKPYNPFAGPPPPPEELIPTTIKERPIICKSCKHFFSSSVITVYDDKIKERCIAKCPKCGIRNRIKRELTVYREEGTYQPPEISTETLREALENLTKLPSKKKRGRPRKRP